MSACFAPAGFGVGLFEEDQLKSENVKEKEQKLAFLTTLTHAVGLALGREIDCNATKVIAGLEPEKTNTLLQGLAAAARNMQSNNNMAQIVAGVKAGAVPGAAAAAPAAAAPAAAPATRARAPAPTSSASSTGPLRPSRAPIALPDAVGGEDFVAITTRLIGALISKPKMVDKLLRKPPFRFIHDIITGVMAATSKMHKQTNTQRNKMKKIQLQLRKRARTTAALARSILVSHCDFFSLLCVFALFFPLQQPTPKVTSPPRSSIQATSPKRTPSCLSSNDSSI